MMRIFAAVVALAAGGCGADVFDTTQTGRSTIPGAPGLLKLFNQFSPFEGLTNFDFAQSQEFKNQGVEKSDVDSVKVVRFELRIVSPASQDFSFLDEIRFYAEAPGQSRVLVARKSGIAQLGLRAPNPVLALDLESETELKPYVVAPSMSITAEGAGRQPDQDTVVEASVTLRVDVDVL